MLRFLYIMISHDDSFQSLWLAACRCFSICTSRLVYLIYVIVTIWSFFLYLLINLVLVACDKRTLPKAMYQRASLKSSDLLCSLLLTRFFIPTSILTMLFTKKYEAKKNESILKKLEIFKKYPHETVELPSLTYSFT